MREVLKNVTGQCFGQKFLQSPRSSTLKIQHPILLLAGILAVPAFAFADNIPGHSKAGNNYVAFSEGLTDQQDSQGNSARCNFLWGSVKENGAKTNPISHASFSEFAKGDMGSNLGALLNTGMQSDSQHVRLVDFGGNQAGPLDKDKGKGRGKPNGASGTGSGTPSPLTSVAEPGSQTLLLFGLAGLGMFFYRRKALANAI
jgi:hypothetical protein